jgi:macrolide-specific efflux system membrane fusion protein
VVTYDVTVLLSNPPADVKSGMTAQLAVTVASASNVLEIPSSAITTAGRISTVVVDRNGKQSTVAVTTGLVGDTTTQILSGLTAGETIVEPSVTVSNNGTSTGTRGGGTGTLGGGGGFLGGGGGGLFGGGGGVGRAG